MDTIISVNKLRKRFGTFTAVEDISFNVQRGQLFALLGTNGAGKSTTISMLCTLLTPDGGTVEIGGHRLGREDQAIRRQIGVVFQENVLDPLLTIRENLLTRARLYGLTGRRLAEAVDAAAAACRLTEYLDRPYGELSGGWRRRADIARALVHQPEILFLDEPTTGLDPQTRADVWAQIRALQNSSGMTVLLTTHYLEEAAAADDIVIMDHGRIAAHGTPAALQAQYCTDTLRLTPRPASRQALLTQLAQQGLDYDAQEALVTLTIEHTLAAIPLLASLEDYLESFEVLHGTLNDVFMQIAGGDTQHA